MKHGMDDERWQDVATVMEQGYSLLLFTTTKGLDGNFQTYHGTHGAAFFFERDGFPESIEDCVYGNSPKEAMIAAIKRWR